MSEYDTLKNGIVARLKSLGYIESKDVFDFDDASQHTYNKEFILTCESGEMDEEQSETMVGRFYDVQQWGILIAFNKSEHNDVINRDMLHREKDAILKDIDNPTNWESFARILKYKAWDIEEKDSCYILKISLIVQVKYSY